MNIILATAANGAIGLKGSIPWHFPWDLQNFKNLTMGSAVIMGRGTWDSLPKRPLQGRTNIVISKTFRLDSDQAYTVGSLNEALSISDNLSLHSWIMGGALLYREALAHPRVKEVHLTRLNFDVEGDSFVQIPPEFYIKNMIFLNMDGSESKVRNSFACYLILQKEF